MYSENNIQDKFIKWLEYLKALNEINSYSTLLAIDETPEEFKNLLKEHFKYNLADWINFTCVADDPDHPYNLRRFILFPKQKEEIIDWIEEYIRADCPSSQTKIWEKSRRVGWTNTLLCCLAHAAIFWERSSIVATKDLASGDTLGDIQNSLLPRIRLILEHQVPFVLPESFKLSKCTKGIIRFGGTNNATIRAMPTANPSSASKLGRSGRVRFVIFDEAGFWNSNNLELAFGACAMTAKIRILFSSASNSNSHFFSRLVDGAVITGLKGTWIPFESNPANTPEHLEELRRQNSFELIEQEVFGKRGGNSSNIINKVSTESYKNEEGNYSLAHPFIASQLRQEGYLFTCYDGGMKGNYTGAVLGYHVERFNRDIIIKEFSSEFKREPIGEIALRMENYIKILRENLWASTGERSYGDPSLKAYEDDQEIFLVTGRHVNLLDSLKAQGDYTPHKSLGELYRNRKTNRINILRRKLRKTSELDSKPELLWLRNEAPLFHDALIEGGYRWEKLSNGTLSGEIEQNHPLVDIVESYTYRLLETEPIAMPTG